MPAFVAILLSGTLSGALSLLPYYRPDFLFLSYFSALPLFFVGLGRGMVPFCGAGLLATVLIFLGGGWKDAGEFALFAALLPGILLSRALLNRSTSSGEISWYPSSLLLRDFTLLSGCVALGFGTYFFPQAVRWGSQEKPSKMRNLNQG